MRAAKVVLNKIAEDQNFTDGIALTKKDLAARGLTVVEETTSGVLMVTGFEDGKTRTIQVCLAGQE